MKRQRSGWRVLGCAAGLAFVTVVPACNGKFEFDVPGARAGTGGGGAGGLPSAGAGGLPGAGAGGLPSAGTGIDSSGSPHAAPGGAGGGSADDTCGAHLSCPAGLYCVAGECRECAVDSDCQSSGQSRCSPDRHRCVACLQEQDCADGFACDALANRCLRKCADEQACRPDLHGCDEGRGVCYECDEDYECEAAPTGPLCATDGSGCVQCRSDSDCEGEGEGELCDPLSGSCVACRDGRDCTSGLCDPLLHVCLTG